MKRLAAFSYFLVVVIMLGIVFSPSLIGENQDIKISAPDFTATVLLDLHRHRADGGFVEGGRGRMNQQLAITLQSLTVGATEGYWLKLATVKLPDDSVTLDEAAEFIDELYSLEACDPPEEDDGGGEPDPDPDEGDLPPPIEEEEFLDLARGLLADSALCAADGDYECQLRVARSHRDVPYKLTFDRGREELRRTVADEAYQALTVENSSNVTLDLPVVGSVAAQWDGQVYDQAGPCAPATITVLASTLNFGKEVTGSLTVGYPTE